MNSINDVLREIDAALERYRRARILVAALDETASSAPTTAQRGRPRRELPITVVFEAGAEIGTGTSSVASEEMREASPSGE